MHFMHFMRWGCKNFLIFNSSRALSLVLAPWTSHLVKHSLPNIYRPQRSCGQGNIFTPVCHSVHRGGGVLPKCMLEYHTPPEQTPPEQTHPPRADTPPPGPDSSIRSTSGRYASYWNAFLYSQMLTLYEQKRSKITYLFLS